jgi:hypothetical protein
MRYWRGTMGADNFEAVGYGEHPGRVFPNLVEDALWMHGHAGYSGTIAEKQRYVRIGKVGTLEEARTMGRKLMADEDPRIDDKWGPAGCIEFEGKEGVKGWLFFGWASS